MPSPPGGALAVDRDQFSRLVTQAIEDEPRITLRREEVTDLPAGPVIVATGPLTSEPLAEKILALCGGALSFFDAAAPIVTRESLDMDHCFTASRYGREEEGSQGDYVNCPMNKEEYDRFVQALVTAERAPVHSFDARDPKVYEGCMPIEVLASRGHDAIRFGPMKPVGLKDPRTGHRPWAVLQLRTENREKTLFNLVGFQTNLKFGEQKRVFGMIPGLAHAEFVRYGVMHRNTFLNSQRCWTATSPSAGGPGCTLPGRSPGWRGIWSPRVPASWRASTWPGGCKGESPCSYRRPPCWGPCPAMCPSTAGRTFSPWGPISGCCPPCRKKSGTSGSGIWPCPSGPFAI